MKVEIEFTINGRRARLDCDGSTPLLSVLRERLALHGTKYGCGTEQCGACMVLIDGKPGYSCARGVDGRR
jgi:nicotinate dehydrogenase subunit A